MVQVYIPLLDRSRDVGVVVGPYPARDVDAGAGGAGGAPAAGVCELWAEGPFSRERIENQRLREGGEEVVVGGGEDDELAGDGDGLDRELPGDEGRVAEKEAERPVRRRRRERVPLGGDRIEGGEFEGDGEVVVVAGGYKEGVEREKRWEG